MAQTHDRPHLEWRNADPGRKEVRFARSRSLGFTLIELMVVVVVMGILAAIALPNYLQMRDRANEAGVKTNMHTLQLHSEDYGVLNDGVFSDVIDAGHIANALPEAFSNPYTALQGSGVAWENRDVFAGLPSTVPGIASYSDSATMTYNIKGQARHAPIPITLTCSQ